MPGFSTSSIWFARQDLGFFLTVWHCCMVLALARSMASPAGDRQGSAGKEPTGAAGANLLDAHQALPRWKEPPGPGTAGASSKHHLLYTKVWVRLVNTFQRAPAGTLRQSRKCLMHFFCPCMLPLVLYSPRVMETGSFLQSQSGF